jgi:uncharacterized membrane protein
MVVIPHSVPQEINVGERRELSPSLRQSPFMRKRRVLIISFVLAAMLVMGVYFGVHFLRNRTAHAPAATVPTSGSVSKAPETSQLYGQWQVVTVAGASPVTTMDGEAVSRLAGQTLYLSAQKLQFAGQTCSSTYETSTETVSEFTQEYRVDPAAMNLPDRITQVDGGCADLFPQRSNQLLFTWGGYFLEANKVSGGN